MGVRHSYPTRCAHRADGHVVLRSATAKNDSGYSFFAFFCFPPLKTVLQRRRCTFLAYGSEHLHERHHCRRYWRHPTYHGLHGPPQHFPHPPRIHLDSQRVDAGGCVHDGMNPRGSCWFDYVGCLLHMCVWHCKWWPTLTRRMMQEADASCRRWLSCVALGNLILPRGVF